MSVVQVQVYRISSADIMGNNESKEVEDNDDESVDDVNGHRDPVNLTPSEGDCNTEAYSDEDDKG